MARSAALRSPSAPSPAPAGDFGPGIDRERRRGRGAPSNASGRCEPEARLGLDDGWDSLEALPPLPTSLALHAPPKILHLLDAPGNRIGPLSHTHRALEA